jgi:copper resistance protein C
MKSRSILAVLLTVLVSSLATLQVAAHTKVESVSPPDGSVLEASPAVVEMRFHDAVSLTAVVVIQADKIERTLIFTPKGSANAFRLPDPQLAAGRNEIRWKALSKDGHVIGGSLHFEIKPAVAKAP